MATQEVWFPDVDDPPDQFDGNHPSHGCVSDSTDDGSVVVVAYTDTGPSPVTPADHPRLHTILDPGQPLPAICVAAQAAGFEVTYHLHGSLSPWTLAAAAAAPKSARTRKGADNASDDKK